MKKTLVTTLIVGLSAIIAHAESPSLQSLVEKLQTPAYQESIQRNAIYTEANKNSEFYDSLKSAGFVFEGVKLSDSNILRLQLKYRDFAAINPVEAAKLSIAQYKPYIAARVLEIGETIAAYDWLQEQRLNAVQSGSADAKDKADFIQTVAEQVLASAKAKQD